MKQTKVVAIDLGASSGRLISGSFDGERIILKEHYRFNNHPVELLGSLYWDYLNLIQEIRTGLAICYQDLGEIASLDVDTWGVDYGLIGKNGQLLHAPYSYRDARSSKVLAEFSELVSPQQLFELTGTRLDAINSVVQLFADLKQDITLQQRIAKVVYMPNLIKYFLSGQISNETTIASTSGLIDTQTGQVNQWLCDKLGFKSDWFNAPTTVKLGSISLADNQSLEVLNGIGHDTAAALCALPITTQKLTQTAFISCGTWSIVGVQTAKPITSQAAFTAGLTNEGCVGGHNRLLKNITGLWIIQELKRQWQQKGQTYSFTQLSELATKADFIGSFIDPNASVFSSPTDMEATIKTYLVETKQKQPQDKGELLRLVYESLAQSYAETLTLLEQVTGHKIQEVYLFGGGIQAKILVDLTCKYTKRQVKLGPVEASVLGNIVHQLEILGEISQENKAMILNETYVTLKQ